MGSSNKTEFYFIIVFNAAVMLHANLLLFFFNQREALCDYDLNLFAVLLAPSLSLYNVHLMTSVCHGLLGKHGLYS